MRICVYGASSDRIDPSYIERVEQMTKVLAQHGHSLVYGAGGAGLMGAAARGMKQGGGHVIGVVPSFLNIDGVVFDRCDEIICTETMRQRKQIMEEKADAFVAVPGSVGTYEELFEIFTLKQLEQQDKPLILYNINHYFDPLLALLRHTVKENFMREASLQLVSVAFTPKDVLEQLQAEQPHLTLEETKYITKKE